MPAWRHLCALLAAATAAAETPCQQCCAPGGDCSKAYKGTPGKCCGTENGQAYCCPGLSYRAGSGDAKCYKCEGAAYRCYTGSSRSICGSAHRTSNDWARYRVHRQEQLDDRSSVGVMVLMGVGIVMGVLFCTRRQYDTDPVRARRHDTEPWTPATPFTRPSAAAQYAMHPSMYPPGPYTPVGKPIGMPCGQPMHYGYGGGYGGGYSGGAVAGSAAAGFVGGMLLSEARGPSRGAARSVCVCVCVCVCVGGG